MVGWVVGVVVVLLAAALLVAVIALGRRIVRQAQEITVALDGARENTDPMFDITRTNLAIDRTTRGLARVREAQTPSEPGGMP